MSDILKEAIADAKAVRETALQNARVALEEAFAPRIQSMLSAKLKETDVDDQFDDEEEFDDEFGGEDEFGGGGDEFGDEFEAGAEKLPVPDVPAQGDVPMGGESPGGGFGDEELPVGDEFGGEGEVEDTITLNGNTYRLVSNEEIAQEAANFANSEDVYEESDNLDLESIIRELEQELSEEDELEESDNPYSGNEQHNQYKDAPKGTTASVKKEKFSEADESEDEDELEEGAVEEDSTSLGFDPTGAKRRSVDEKSQGSLSEGDDDEIVEIEFDDDEDDDGLDEELKSSGIGKGENHDSEYFSSDTEDPQGQGFKKEKFSENKKLRSELKEYKGAVKFLRDKLHEVNILNAKLLYTNRLFKEYLLNNDQKVNIVETFDRAKTIREIKLVYSTLAEGFNGNTNIKRKTLKESAGGSSKAISSTKPTRKVITEENEVADRFKRLAGLIK